MLLDDRFDVLVELGASLKDVYFRAIPDMDMLSALYDGADDIKFFLSTYKTCGGIEEYAECEYASSIITANFKTDVFIDSIFLPKYPNIVDLVLTCNNHQIDCLDIEDVASVVKNLLELKKLSSITFDVQKMKVYPVEQLMDHIMLPGKDVEIEFSLDKKQKKRLKQRS